MPSPRAVDHTARIRAWVLAGRSDDEIARALGVSVKVVRVVRRAVEAEVRPRGLDAPSQLRPRRHRDDAAWLE